MNRDNFSDRRRILRAAGALGMAGTWLHAMPARAAAEFPIPGKPVRIIAPSGGGGPTDTVARILAERLAPSLKVPVIVDNKPGAVGSIALNLTAKAPPDGHTLLVGFVSANVIFPLLNQKLPFDARKDFTPITQVMSGGVNLMANPALPANNLQEFIAYAKKQPKPISYGSFGSGSTAHLAGEYLQILTGIKMVHIPYKGGSDSARAVMAGEADILFDASVTAVTNAAGGRMKLLAVVGPSRIASIPNVPTMEEAGFPGFSEPGLEQLFVPVGTPPELVNKMNAAVMQAARTPEVKSILERGGFEPVYSTPEEHARIMKRSYDYWGGVIKRTGITLD